MVMFHQRPVILLKIDRLRIGSSEGMQRGFGHVWMRDCFQPKEGAIVDFYIYKYQDHGSCISF